MLQLAFELISDSESFLWQLQFVSEHFWHYNLNNYHSKNVILSEYGSVWFAIIV